MGLDEEGTLARLKAVRKSLVDPTIAKHHGRIVKTTGDGMLVEFASVVDAGRCAAEAQRGMAEQNAAVPQNTEKLNFASVSTLETSSIDDNDIFGDGVQYRRAAGEHGGAGRHLHVGRRLSADPGQGRHGLRRYGLANSQEYH